MTDNNLLITLPVTPCPKPRMTQRDKWLNPPRPRVARYRAFCDEVRLLWGNRTYPLANAHIKFNLPMPKSWSAKKRAEMVGQPHQVKPDKDNLEKAFMDALLKNDACVWDSRVTKRWAIEGSIEVLTFTEVGHAD